MLPLSLAFSRTRSWAFLGGVAFAQPVKWDVIHKQVQVLLLVQNPCSSLFPFTRSARGVCLLGPEGKKHEQRVIWYLCEHVLVLALALAVDARIAFGASRRDRPHISE